MWLDFEIQERIHLKTIFYEREMQVPLLKQYNLTGEFRPESLRLCGGRYMLKIPFELRVSEFQALEEVIPYWKSNRDSWASFVSTGSSWSGWTGYSYFSPNSNQAEKKDTDFKVVRSLIPVSEWSGSVEIISHEFKNGEQSGRYIKLGEGFTAKLERMFIELDKGIVIVDGEKVNHFICCSETNVNTLEEFMRMHPKISKDYF